jgi:hypothetical protein
VVCLSEPGGRCVVGRLDGVAIIRASVWWVCRVPEEVELPPEVVW